MPLSVPLRVQEDGNDVVLNTLAANFVDPDTSLVTQSPTGFANIDMSLYLLGSGVRSASGAIDVEKAAGVVFTGTVSTESFPRMELSHDQLGFGDGTGAVDTVIRRSNADEWTADDLMIFDAGAQISSNQTLIFRDDDDSNFIAFLAGAMTNDTTYTWPTDYPAVAGYVLSSDLSGNMSWIVMSGGPGGSTVIVQEDDVTVDAAATTLDFLEPLATIVSSTPAGEANINLAAYLLANGARALSGNLDVGTNLLLNIGAVGTDFTSGGGLNLAGNLDMQTNLVVNIGAAGTDFTSGGGLNLAGALDMQTNVISNIGAAGTDFSATGGLALADALNMQNNLILNIGNAGTDFTAGGGLTLAGTLTLTPFTTGSVLFVGASAAVSEHNSTFFWDDTNSRLLLGTTTGTLTISGASTGARVVNVTSAFSDAYALQLRHHNSSGVAAGPVTGFFRSRGLPGAETIVDSADILGNLVFHGHDGTDYETAAAIRCEVDGTPGSGDMPGRLVFLTTPNGSVIPSERMVIGETGFITVGTGGTFTLAAGDGDLGVNGEFEVNGQTRFDNTIGFQTAPLANTIFTADVTSATIIQGVSMDMTVQPTSGLSSSGMAFVVRDESASSTALLNVFGITATAQYARLVANQPASYAQHALRVANYGVVSGTTITSGTYNYHGLSINVANAGANVSGGTHTLYDILTDTAPTGFPVGTRHYSIKLNDDSWIVDAPFWFGTAQGCSIMFDGTNWLFDTPGTVGEISFNDSGTDTNFRVESNDKANMIFMDAGTNRLGIGDATAPASILEIEELTTLSAGLGDGLAAMIHLDPGYTGAFTVTRHNYLKMEQPSVAASAVVTDACVMWFDAAIGTHKAVDSGTTKVSGNVVTAWVKININGTVHYMPAYASKTS